MVLTLTGNVFLNDIDEALRLIRKAEVEATSGNMGEARSLRLGLVEDFDSEIAPELARRLAAGMQEYPQHVAETIVGTMRRLIRLRAIEPTIASIPWLEDMFHLMPERGANPEF